MTSKSWSKEDFDQLYIMPLPPQNNDWNMSNMFLAELQNMTINKDIRHLKDDHVQKGSDSIQSMVGAQRI